MGSQRVGPDFGTEQQQQYKKVVIMLLSTGIFDVEGKYWEISDQWDELKLCGPNFKVEVSWTCEVFCVYVLCVCITSSLLQKTTETVTNPVAMNNPSA